MNRQEQFFTIKQVSTKFNIPKPTLHFWEKELDGIIIPIRSKCSAAPLRFSPMLSISEVIFPESMKSKNKWSNKAQPSEQMHDRMRAYNRSIRLCRAGAVVTNAVPDYAFVAGNPAKNKVRDCQIILVPNTFHDGPKNILGTKGIFYER